MYLAFVRRKAVEEVTTRKISMVSALYANTNYDSSEGREARTQFIQAIEDNCSSTILRIYGTDKATDIYKIDKDDPFFAAMKLPEDVMKEVYE